MNEFEVMALVFFVLVAVAITVYIKLKQAEKRIESLLKAEEARRADAAYQERVKRRERLAEFAKTNSPSNSGFIQPTRSTSKTVASTYVSSPTTVVVDNSSNDMLTAMIIQDALNKSYYEVPTTHYSNTSDPVDFPAPAPEPSYTSSYSSPSSSYSSSNSDSSYSSSYSSSSSDSSYSSSSDSSSSDSGSSSSSD